MTNGRRFAAALLALWFVTVATRGQEPPRGPADPAAARRDRCAENLKRIGEGALSYKDANDGRFPRDVLDEEGEPLLSWRVAILPYIGQKELHDKFKLDEPWNSPRNKPLAAEVPEVFRCPERASDAPTLTRYQGFEGAGALFDPEEKVSVYNVTDGTINTILAVETTKAVPWTKPGGLPFDPLAIPARRGVGSNHPGGFHVLTASGKVHFLEESVPSSAFLPFVTYNAGEVVEFRDWLAK